MAQFDDLATPEDMGRIIGGHIQLYLTDPEKAHYFDTGDLGGPGIVPTLLLTTIGRKSGETRHAPILYMNYGDDYLVIASKGGMPENPAWYVNLVANAECEIRVASLHAKARARVLEGAERAAAWREVATAWPIYQKYQDRTEREIPLVALQVVSKL